MFGLSVITVGVGNPYNFVQYLLNDCDICMIQEHWLFSEQLQSLNVSDEFSSIAVSGMFSTEFIAGRPFGGCAILYRNSRANFISTIKTHMIYQTISVANSVKFLTLSRRMCHHCPSCKISVVLMYARLIQRPSQKPWEN
jgi:hypothetical protein